MHFLCAVFGLLASGATAQWTNPFDGIKPVQPVNTDFGFGKAFSSEGEGAKMFGEAEGTLSEGRGMFDGLMGEAMGEMNSVSGDLTGEMNNLMTDGMSELTNFDVNEIIKELNAELNPLSSEYSSRFSEGSRFSDPFGGELPLESFGALEERSGGERLSAFDLFSSNADASVRERGANGELGGGFRGAIRRSGAWTQEDSQRFFARNKECNEKMDAATKVLSSAARPIITPVAKGKKSQLAKCRQRVAGKGKPQMQALFGALNSRTTGFMGVAGGSRAPRDKIFSSGLNNLFQEASGTQTDDFGTFVETDAAESCRKLIDDDFRMCEQEAENLCGFADDARVASSPDLARAAVAAHRNERTTVSALTGCRCIGMTYNKSIKSNRNAAPKCTEGTAERLSGLESGQSSFTSSFLGRQGNGEQVGGLFGSSSDSSSSSSSLFDMPSLADLYNRRR